MKKTALCLAALVCAITCWATDIRAHCEIPCGIYDDALRVRMIREDIATIEKSMLQIIEINKHQSHDPNQLVRWILNKENHATRLQETVTQYFMTQRIKPETPDYEKKLVLLHKMLLAAMRCKQTLDQSIITDLRKLVDEFETAYFAKKQD